MAKNIEIKARVADFNATLARAAALSDSAAVDIIQDDTFFACPNGRLKLRAFSAAHGELIFYQRADQDGPKASFYVITQTHEPDVLREVLTLAYTQAGRVAKVRTLLMVGRTRIHLDRVRQLGDFLELEVVLREDEADAVGVREAQQLMSQLGIEPEQLVTSAYVDLLTQH